MDSLFCNLETCFGGRPQQNRCFSCGLSLLLWMAHLGMFLLPSLLGSSSWLCMLSGLCMHIPPRYLALYHQYCLNLKQSRYNVLCECAFFFFFQYLKFGFQLFFLYVEKLVWKASFDHLEYGPSMFNVVSLARTQYPHF